MYPDPIRLATVSDTGANKMVYDENDAAGIVSLAAEVGALADMTVSSVKNLVKKPSDTPANKKMGASYDIYVDI